MKTIFSILILQIGLLASTHAQVAINTNGDKPHNSAQLDVKSTTKGMLIPKLTAAQRSAITNPAQGLIVFDPVIKDFFYYDGSAWQSLESRTTPIPSRIENSANTIFVDTDNYSPINNRLLFGVSGNRMLAYKETDKAPVLSLLNPRITAIGEEAGNEITTATNLTAFGYNSGKSTFGTSVYFGAQSGRNAKGSTNLGIGKDVAYTAVSSNSSVYIGHNSAKNKTNGIRNIMIGQNSGLNNINGNNNIFIGYETGLNATGSEQLFIDNSSTSSPLIWGDFNLNKVVINGSLKVAKKLSVIGGILRGYPTTDNLSGLHILDSGNIGISTTEANQKLTVKGDMTLSGNLKFGNNLALHAVGGDDNENMYMITGRINSNGNIDNDYSYSGGVISSEKYSEGKYRINIEFENDDNGLIYLKKPTVLATAFHGSGENRYATVESVSNSQVEITIRNQNGDRKNASFCFVIMGRKK